MMKSACFWTDPTYRPGNELVGPHATSYLIVGGGIGGLFLAHFLLKAGMKSIAIVEKDTVGSGSTGYSAGMLMGEIETAPWSMIVRKFGAHKATLYARAQNDARREVLRLIKKEMILCDHETQDFVLLKKRSAVGRLWDADTDFDTENLEREFESPALFFGERLGRAVSVNPLKLAHGIARYLRQRHVHIFEHTPLISVETSAAKTPRGRITFQKILYASGTYQTHPRLTNYATTIAVTKPLTTEQLKQVCPRKKYMFLDEAEHSYHYGKMTRDNRLLIGYGDTRVDSSKVTRQLYRAHLTSIRGFLKQTLDLDLPIEHAWSAAYSLSKQLLPIVTVSKNAGTIAGAGTQLATIASASLLVNTLLRKPDYLGPLFKVDKRRTPR